MIDLLIRYFLGFYNVLIYGNKYSIDRFLNILNYNKITYWKCNKRDDSCFFCICFKDYKKIIKPLEKSGIRHEIVCKIGLPYFFNKHKKRKIFFVCLFISLLYFANLNRYIWNIKIISGNYYSDLYIEEEISDMVKVGTKKNDLNCKKLEDFILNKYNQFAWVNCYIKGTTLYCEFSEVNNPNINNPTNKPCDIIACYDCIIDSSIANNGNNMVSSGQTVKKGDILISGTIEIKNDYYEVVDTKYVNADGEVIGIVKHDYKKEISMDFYNMDEIPTKSKWNIGYGNHFFFKSKNNGYEVLSENHQLKVGKDVYLPFVLQKNTLFKSDIKKNSYTRKEASNIQKNILKEYIDEMTKYGVEIVENNVKIYFEDKKCIAKGIIITKENVGIPKVIDSNVLGE